MESLSETDVALYHRPRALGEALRCLSAHDVTIVAGATDVYPGQVSNQMWSGSRSQKSWLDISGIEALQGIAERDDHYRIGALATWADLIDSSLPPGFDGLIAAAKGVGGQQGVGGERARGRRHQYYGGGVGWNPVGSVVEIACGIFRLPASNQSTRVASLTRC